MKKLCYIFLLATILLFSCKTKTIFVPVETETVKKEYVDRWHRDSIYLHDSIFMKQKGDTIWLEKYKTLYREKLVRDSILIIDSVRVEVPYAVVETKEVNRLKNWQILLMCLGGVLIGYTLFRVARWIK